MTNLNEIEEKIEIVNQVIEQTKNSVEVIYRLLALVDQYKETMEKAIKQNTDLIEMFENCRDERDRARATAVRLEQECHSCMDTVHHGNEDVYDA